MTTQTKDFDDNEKTFGSRLKLAREEARYTRPALAEETGIPAKSLEKYEYGTMSPDIVRLRNIATILNVSISYLIDGEQEEITAQNNEILEEDYSELMNNLRVMDDARESGFSKLWRTVPRLFESLNNSLNDLEFDELLDVAEKRELYIISEEQSDEIMNALGDDQDNQIGEIVERIIDTAIFGLDLYSIYEKDLSDLADELEIEPDDVGIIFTSWSGYSALVSSLRAQCRELALKGKAPQFLSDEDFRKREIA